VLELMGRRKWLEWTSRLAWHVHSYSPSELRGKVPGILKIYNDTHSCPKQLLVPALLDRGSSPGA
jgi:hypothetical protein